MLSTACPKCGRPSPLSLASPDRVQCPTCGFAGALPFGVQAQLAGAQRILQSIGLRERQLTAQQQRALTSSRSAALGYWLATAAAGVPLLGCGVLGSISMLRGKDASGAGAIVLLAPLVLFVAAAVLGQRTVKKRYAALRIACAAVPPPSPGQPAGCHVCGAPLAPGSGAIARCGFCSADNVIAPDALAAAASARATNVADIETTVRRQATLARSVARQATLAIVASAIGAPFFTFAALVAIFAVLSLIEGPLDTSSRYGLVKGGSGTCVAKVYPRTDGKWALAFGAGLGQIEVRDRVDDIPPLALDRLVGKRVKAGASNRPPAGVIQRVHGTLAGYNRVVIGGSDYEPAGLCLDEP